MIPIDPETTIAELVEVYPDLRSVLKAKGIDTCCGRFFTVAQAAKARGIPLGELLSAFEATPYTPPLIERSDSVPTAASVSICRAFIKAALVATMTLGASFGAYNLLMIHWALGPVPPAHSWVHAGFQLWGFVLLFIMGVSYHVVPRFLGAPLKHVKLARSTLWLSLGALLFVAWGRFGEMLPGTLPALIAGTVQELLAVVGWAGVLAATWYDAKPRPARFHRFLIAGTLWWIVAAVFLVVGAVRAAFHDGLGWDSRWNEAIYAAILYGGALSWIQGMFLRAGPVFLSLPTPRDRAVDAAFWLGLMGAALTTLAGAASGRVSADVLNDAGLLAVAGSVMACVLGVRPFTSHATHMTNGDRDFVRIVRLAFVASMLFAVLAVTYAVLDLTRQGPHRLIYDGVRHAYTLGFVTLMIFGMAGRIVPIIGGTTLRWPALRGWGATLIAGGMVLREAEVAAVWLKEPWFLNISGVSGIIEAAGVCMASISILGTLRTATRP